ncbi:CHAT domain-containing protein [Iningainema tapete]|uniref:CHAT domain-containing protein n=1 Tax=Iningainema tapete BLCC-T55 TaxID=2748662 RepID=A0A8J6XPI5_9CYAN|nr:CHAT domain-containing protein [Iningainema tapete BLCC-T55]
MANQFRKSRRFLVVLFLVSFTCSWYFGLQISATAQIPNASYIVQQGVERYQAGDLTGAIEVWETALKSYQQNNSAQAAIVRENLARVHQQLGKPSQAISYWNQVIAYYRQVGNLQQVGRSLTEQAQAYNSLGQTKSAIALLCNPDFHNNCHTNSALQIARATSDSIGEVAALGSLGDAMRLRGDYESAIKNLDPSLALAKKLNNSTLLTSVLNSLGNAQISLALVKYRQANSAVQRGDSQEAEKLQKRAKLEDDLALSYLSESRKIARSQKDMASEMRSLLAIIPIYYRNNGIDAASSLQQATKLLDTLPDSRGRVYATIELVSLLQPNKILTPTECLAPSVLPQAESLLNQAVSVAQRLQDYRAESFALGELGHIYECRNKYPQALDITSRAKLAAQQDLKAQDSLYLWEWQTGRILKAQGKTSEAISAYEQAINTLESIRSDILTANRDIQFDFRDTIEPIYRDLVALRLNNEQPVQTASKSLISKSKDNFRFILKTIDSLKLAELQNFFGNDCIITAVPQAVDTTSNSTTAFLNTIVLSDKTAVILSLPKGERKLSWISINRQELVNKINEFRRGLERFRDDYDTTLAQEIYNWLIRPFAKDLSGIKTLVFIQDGILRSVPMAALYDGEKKQYLIQQYAIATTPSLNLTDTRPLNQERLRVLALGLSQAATVDGKTFPPLSNVDQEITEVTQKMKGKKLLNHEFTISGLKKELSQTVYPVIHIATHGEFGSEPQDTFIVTGNNEKLTFTELERQIRSVTRSQLELLTLTACETAVGDERSTLGLAGVAVQAGARSALASLWAINDASTVQIVTDFYSKLLSERNVTKAQALQAAQTALIEDKQYSHPYYWSGFILIGNWL